MARKTKLTPRQILTYLSILALIISLAGGAGYKFSTPAETRADEQTATHEADFKVQHEIDTTQDRRIKTMETSQKTILEDLGGLKEGQKRIEESLKQMASNQ